MKRECREKNKKGSGGCFLVWW